MKKQIVIMSVVVFTLMIAMSSLALAHETSDQAADTPLGSQQARDNALDNLIDAISNSDGDAANSLFRNPTCGAHFSPNGIHPQGNP